MNKSLPLLRLFAGCLLVLMATFAQGQSISVSTSGDNIFETTQCTPSQALTLTYTLSGQTQDALITVPTGFEIRVIPGSFGQTAIIPLGQSTATVEVRLSGRQTGSFSGFITTQSSNGNVSRYNVAGTVTGSTASALTASPTALTNFSTSVGVNSAAQTYTLVGCNLAGNVTVTPPAGYAISTGGGFGTGAIQLTPSGGSLEQTISVRLTGASSGTITGTINHASGSASATVALNGIVSGSTSGTTGGGQSLSMTAPSYTCTTGAFRFNTAGGDGTPVSFSAIGITGPTTNPNVTLPEALQQAILRQDVGLQPITLFAGQSGRTATFSWDARNACQGGNLPPTVTGMLTNQTAIVGESFTYSLPANLFSDPEGQSLMVAVTGLPSGLNYLAGTISGSPSTTVGSPFSVSVTATDPGGLSARATFTITVLTSGTGTSGTGTSGTGTTGNQAPTVSGSLTNQTAIVGILFNYTLPATLFTDPDGQQITLTASGLPTGFTLTGGMVRGIASSTVGSPYSVTIIGTDPGGLSARASFLLTLLNPSGPQPFRLIEPTYNCATAAFVFNTVGGTGGPISYSALGITSPTNNPITRVDPGLDAAIRRQDPTVEPILLWAAQGNISVTYLWNALAACGTTQPPPTTLTGCGSPSQTIGQPLQLDEPFYDCQTGQIQFRTTGGTGAPIEFMALGITGWTTSCTDIIDRGNTDNSLYSISARQGNVIVTRSWIRPCPSLRQATPLREGTLQVTVLGNPPTDGIARVEINGAEGKSLTLELFTETGQRIQEQHIEKANASQQAALQLGQSKGIYLLRVATPTEQKTVRVLKW